MTIKNCNLGMVHSVQGTYQKKTESRPSDRAIHANAKSGSAAAQRETQSLGKSARHAGNCSRNNKAQTPQGNKTL